MVIRPRTVVALLIASLLVSILASLLPRKAVLENQTGAIMLRTVLSTRTLLLLFQVGAMVCPSLLLRTPWKRSKRRPLKLLRSPLLRLSLKKFK
jgi:hypothetical protein